MSPTPAIRAFALAALFLTPVATPIWAQDDRPVFKAVERIQAENAKRRGLEYQVPVPVGMKTPDEIKAMILSEFETEAPAEQMAKEEKVAKAFGLIPADYDLRTKMIEFLAENIGGYYDPEAKELFLVDMSKNPQMQGANGMMQGSMEEMVMAHELQHALQDQNFDLQRWMTVLSDMDDRMQAFKSVVEGEAQLVGMTHMFKRDVDLAQLNRMQETMLQMSPEGKKLRETPPYLVENMMFPYTQGAEFVQTMQRKHGWNRVTEAFRNPPTSTEQILHPEKFLGAERDEPVELLLSGLTGPLGKGVDELDTGTLGEFNVSVLLRALGVGKREAAKAAAGWDGDAYAGFQTKDGRVVLVWLSTWDSADEAGEFEQLYRAALTKSGKGGHLERRGSEVLWILGASEQELPGLVRRGFAAVKTTLVLEPLPGFLERPVPAEFTHAEGAAPASPSSAPESGAPSTAARTDGPTLVRAEATGVTVGVPAGFKPAATNEALTARSGQEELQVWSVAGELKDAGAVSAALTRKLSAAQVQTRSGQRLGRSAFESACTVEGAEVRAVAIASEGATVFVSARAAAAERAAALLEQTLRATWLDGRWNPQQVKTISGPGASVSFAWPEGFKEGRAKGAVLCTLDGPDGATVQVVTAPATGSLESMARSLERQLPIALQDFALRVSGVVQRKGTPVHELEFTAQGRRTRQHVFVVGGQSFTVAVSAPEGRFEACMPAFSRVLASVAVAVGQKESY